MTRSHCFRARLTHHEELLISQISECEKWSLPEIVECP